MLPPMTATMYEALPAVMQEEDAARGYPLRQLLQVLGVGIEDIYTAANKFVDLIDVDTCPVAQLAGLSGMLGFDFPYDLSEDQQRAFVRSTVALYRIKGTPAALKFVVTRLIGKGFQLDITNEDWQAKTFTLRLTAQQDNATLNALEGKVGYLVNLYKPAGIIPTLVSSYYFDDAADPVTRQDAHTTRRYDAWRFNLRGTRFNTKTAEGDTVSFNNRGTETLTI